MGAPEIPTSKPTSPQYLLLSGTGRTDRTKNKNGSRQVPAGAALWGMLKMISAPPAPAWGAALRSVSLAPPRAFLFQGLSQLYPRLASRQA